MEAGAHDPHADWELASPHYLAPLLRRNQTAGHSNSPRIPPDANCVSFSRRSAGAARRDISFFSAGAAQGGEDKLQESGGARLLKPGPRTRWRRSGTPVGAVNSDAGTTQRASLAPSGAPLTARLTPPRGRGSKANGHGQCRCDHGLEAVTNIEYATSCTSVENKNPACR